MGEEVISWPVGEMQQFASWHQQPQVLNKIIKGD